MLKELVILFLIFHTAFGQNETTLHLEKRSDHVKAGKMAVATGLLTLGKVALNQLSGKSFCWLLLAFSNYWYV